ncbi:MAG: hypothetical protein JNM68_15140, partial [Dinghuibacter sp.]|nr:hypothetical protein [Dinghuibacter sp.]
MSCFKHTCIILIALSSSLKCCSQERNFTANKNKAIEDLKQYTHRDTARANALINILRQARFKKEYPQVLPYYEEAFLLSKQLGYSEGLARCYMFKAFQARAYLEHKTAVDNFDSAIIVLKHTATPVAAGIKADAFQFKGRTFHDMSNYYEALLSYLEALKYFETRNTEKTSILYFNIANISLNLNNYAQALSYAKKNYTLCLEQLKKQSHVFESHMQMADIHIQLKEYDQAETYVNKATTYLPANEFRHATLYNLYLKKGQVHYYQARYPEALQDLEMAKLNADSSGHTANKAATLKWLSETAMKMNRNELALHYAQQAFALVNDMPRNMIKQETM